MLEKELGGSFVAQRIGERMARAPSMPFVAGALGSIALSAGLMLSRRREFANFVGQWVPTLMLIGVYNKLMHIEHALSIPSRSEQGEGVH